jgi:hypothetical protein
MRRKSHTKFPTHNVTHKQCKEIQPAELPPIKIFRAANEIFRATHGAFEAQ